MDAMGFEDRSPDTLQLTRYNEGHLADYLRLLDLEADGADWREACLLYTSPSPRDQRGSRMPSSA